MGKLTSMHFYAWKKGLKTGMYYLRTKAASAAIKFTVAKQAKAEVEPVTESKTNTTAPSAAEAQAASQAAVNAQKLAEAQKSMTMENQVVMPVQGKSYTDEEMITCSIDNPDECEACGS